jgi:hypothetical protein
MQYERLSRGGYRLSHPYMLNNTVSIRVGNYPKVQRFYLCWEELITKNESNQKLDIC